MGTKLGEVLEWDFKLRTPVYELYAKEPDYYVEKTFCVCLILFPLKVLERMLNTIKILIAFRYPR